MPHFLWIQCIKWQLLRDSIPSFWALIIHKHRPCDARLVMVTLTPPSLLCSRIWQASGSSHRLRPQLPRPPCESLLVNNSISASCLPSQDSGNACQIMTKHLPNIPIAAVSRGKGRKKHLNGLKREYSCCYSMLRLLMEKCLCLMKLQF